MALFMIETSSVFRLRYCVDADNIVDAKQYAKDMLDSTEITEFSQLHVSEDIISEKEITSEEYLQMFNEDNAYLKSWTDIQKKGLINTSEKISECGEQDCCEICV